MATEFTDLESFYRFVGQQFTGGENDLSPEECLALWRAEHPAPEELDESVAAVKQALGQADRGEGMSLDEFDREFRQRHKLSENV